ncbi:MAG: hypothetical protein J0H74_10115 [Chitinophagaceae bacterium]|nr:hypothetical protein [Chitinophagaceae bacterium]
MEDLVIAVNNIEEWQTLNDTDSLGRVFRRAQSVLVGGGKVVLERVQPSGQRYKFEEFTTLEDLEAYKKNVYKYLRDDA